MLKISPLYINLLIPWLLIDEESACNAGDPGSVPGKIPWRRDLQSTPVFLPGEFYRQEPGGLQSKPFRSDMTERLSLSPGELCNFSILMAFLKIVFKEFTSLSISCFFFPLGSYLSINLPYINLFTWRRKWQPTPVLLPGKFHGLRSLVGYSPWDHKESDTTEGLHFRLFSMYLQNISHIRTTGQGKVTIQM